MSRFDSLDRLLAHDDNFRELLTTLIGGASGNDDLNGASTADIPFAGGGDGDVAADTGSDMLDRNDPIATTAYGAGVGAGQNDPFSLLNTIESGHGPLALGQGANPPVTSFAPTSGESGSSTGKTHVTSPPTVTDSPPVANAATPAAPPKNMRRWINTLPQQSFTDANGMQWTVAQNSSGGSPVLMFVPSRFLAHDRT